MKKMNKKLFLVSVFFCILILVGCGIATIFYISDSISPGNDSGTSVSGTFTPVDTKISLITPGTGPSLMLFYVLSSDDENDFPKNSIIGEFNSIYVNKPNGKIISPSISDPVLLTVTYNNSIKYELFAFSDKNKTLFSAPKYIAIANNPDNCNLSFKLSPDNDTSSGYDLVLSIDTSKYTLQTSNNLTRYNSEKFLISTSDLSDSIKDYKAVTENTTTYNCHVFAAMCIFKGINNNNIIWTGLTYLGSLALPTTT